MINGGYLNDFNYFTDQKIISLLMSTNVRSELKTNVIKLQKYCLKNVSNSVPITHVQSPTIKKPSRTYEGEKH